MTGSIPPKENALLSHGDILDILMKEFLRTNVPDGLGFTGIEPLINDFYTFVDAACNNLRDLGNKGDLNGVIASGVSYLSDLDKKRFVQENLLEAAKRGEPFRDTLERYKDLGLIDIDLPILEIETQAQDSSEAPIPGEIEDEAAVVVEAEAEAVWASRIEQFKGEPDDLYAIRVEREIKGRAMAEERNLRAEAAKWPDKSGAAIWWLIDKMKSFALGIIKLIANAIKGLEIKGIVPIAGISGIAPSLSFEIEAEAAIRFGDLLDVLREAMGPKQLS